MFGKQATSSRHPVTLDALLAQLQAAPRRDPLTLRSEDIPSATGIYVWYAKEGGCPVYVGRASGRKGLRHRIWAQHLNPNYLEGREQKFSEADCFQLGCAAAVRGRPCIDKSVFRRNIGRRERIAPGQPTVDYIRYHFELAWVVLPQSEIAILERDLIARIAAKWDCIISMVIPTPRDGEPKKASRSFPRAERLGVSRLERSEERKSNRCYNMFVSGHMVDARFEKLFALGSMCQSDRR